MAGQPPNHPFQQLVSLIINCLSFQAANGVRTNRHRQVWHSQGTPLDLPKPFKKVSAYCHRGDPAPLQIYRVVNTPRRTRPSIGQANDYHIGGCGQLNQHLLRGRNGRRRLPPMNSPGDFILLAQQLLQPGKEEYRGKVFSRSIRQGGGYKDRRRCDLAMMPL